MAAVYSNEEQEQMPCWILTLSHSFFSWHNCFVVCLEKGLFFPKLWISGIIWNTLKTSQKIQVIGARKLFFTDLVSILAFADLLLLLLKYFYLVYENFIFACLMLWSYPSQSLARHFYTDQSFSQSHIFLFKLLSSIVAQQSLYNVS